MDDFGTDDVENTSDAVKYKTVSMFEPKVFVWCVNSETGVSTLFTRSVKGQTVNADVYITKCLPKMVKVIEKHYKNDEMSFVPIWHHAIMQRKRWNGWSRKTTT
jgi:hypothetical protein